MNVIISCILCAILTSFFYVNYDSYNTLYWIYAIFYGFFLGTSIIGTDMMYVESVPKHLTGRMAGFRVASQFLIKSMAILMVGQLWSNHIEWFWYVQSIFIGLAILVTVLLVVINCMYETMHSDVK